MKDKSFILSELDEFELDLSGFNASDLLVNIQGKPVIPFKEEIEALSPEASKLIKAAHQKERAEGVFPLCLSEGLLCLKQTDHDQQIPIFLHLLNPKINPVLNQVSWNINTEEWIINPYLLHLLSFEETAFTALDKPEIYELLRAKGYALEPNTRFLGNFHPYRHSLLKEVIEIKKEADLNHFDFLYQGLKVNNTSKSDPIRPLLFEVDQTQYEAIQQAEQQHLVIEGPPGTGKSQVIGNIIGRVLAEKKQVLLCSQKRQALEVIASKLNACGLGDLMLIRNSQDGIKTSIQSLAKSWEAIEQPLDSVAQDFSGTIRLNWLQGQLQLYHKEGLIGGMSPKDFIDATGIDPTKAMAFRTGMPSYSEWNAIKPILSSIPEPVIHLLKQLKGNSNLSRSFESKLTQLRGVYTALVELEWQELSYSELLEHAQIAQTVHLFSTDTAQRCLPWMRHRKKIKQLRKQLALLEPQLQQAEQSLSLWINVPSRSLLTGIRREISTGGVFQKYRINRITRKWLTEPRADFISLIELTETYHTLFEERLNIHLELIAFGLTNLSTDLSAFNAFETLYDGNLYEQYRSLSKHERNFYSAKHSEIQGIALILKQHLTIKSEVPVYKTLSTLLASFHACIPYLDEWDKIPNSISGPLGEFDTASAYEEAIIASDWNRFTARFPGMHEFLTLSIADELAQIKEQRTSTQERLVHQILADRKDAFDAFHRLIATPNSKLTATDRELKQNLIAGKRILSKLFSRKRNFPSLRSLLESEASLWISLLKPVWLSSPVQIAMDLPLIKNTFDLAIIDEASQMLLSHSLGTIYRSKQLIVAGDSMQMAPSSFFQRRNTHALTLLDQAAFNLPQRFLKFHYRSQHKDLIQFSNVHFYENNLIALPSYPNYRAIASIYLPGNHYKDGINLVEAKAAKTLLIKKMTLKNTRIGLVAFSEKQLNAIISLCTPAERLAIEVALEAELLFLKTVEQIQGDECDEIIITFGYGYNEEGRFDLRFGPLTQEGGDKRLNVLFSRAKRNIHFIHSVCAADFPMSENPTIHVLKKWFSYVENTQTATDSLGIPKVMDYQIDGCNIRIQRWIDLSSHVFDLLTYESILSARGWVIREEAFSSVPDHTRVLPLGDSVKSA